MNTSEIKLDLFRRIDRLTDSELEKFYMEFIEIFNSPLRYSLTDMEKTTINEALQDKNQKYSHEDVVEEAKQMFPNLKFK